MKHSKSRKTTIRYIKCCKCPKTKNKVNTRKMKTRKMKKNKANTRKVNISKKMTNKLGRGPPDYFKDYLPKEQLEKVIQLLYESKLSDIVNDEKTNKPLNFNSTTWSKLTYWNASQMFNSLGNQDDMKNIVYMLKHDSYEHKKSNKDIWKKHINDAVFKDKYLHEFKNKSYNGPTIHRNSIKKITLKDLTIILLENRLDIMKWMEQNLTKEHVDLRAAEQPSMNTVVLEQKKIPDDWNAEDEVNAKPITNKEVTPDDWNAEDEDNTKPMTNKEVTPDDWNAEDEVNTKQITNKKVTQYDWNA